MICSAARKIAIGIALIGVFGSASADDESPTPVPIYHELGALDSKQGLSSTIKVGHESHVSISKTDQYDVFKFSINFPSVTGFKVMLDEFHDYGTNEDGIVQYAWGTWGEDDPVTTALEELQLHLVCNGTIQNGTCEATGDGGALIKNYALSLPPLENPVAGEIYWIGIRNYADFTTYTLSIAAAANAVPEPGTCGLLLSGFGLMGFVGRRRKSKLV